MQRIASELKREWQSDIYRRKVVGVWQTGTMPGNKTIGEGVPAYPRWSPTEGRALGGLEERKRGTVLTDL